MDAMWDRLLTMSALDIYHRVQGWQALLGSLFGFLALMSGALFNFWLNRRRDTALRREEARAVAAALYGEITALRVEAARLANVVVRDYEGWGVRSFPKKPFDEYFVAANRLSDPLLYKELAGKVGLLNADLALQIIRFYLNVQKANFWLPFLTPVPTRPVNYSPLSVLVPAIAAINDIVPGLRQIESWLRMPATPDNFDIKTTEVMVGVWLEEFGR